MNLNATVSSYQIDTKFQNCSQTTNFTAAPGDGIYAMVLPFEPCDEDSQVPRHFWPIYVALYAFEPSPAISVTRCSPTITLHNASVFIGVQDSTVQSVTLLEDPQMDEEDNKLSQNISTIPDGLLSAGDSFIGLNGFFWDELANLSDLYCEKTIIDQFRTVLWMTVENGPGLDRIFAPRNNLTSIVESLYEPYLAMLARSYYYTEYDNVRTTLKITQFEQRLSMNDVTVHYLALALVMFACAGLAVQELHRRDSRKLRVYFLPGTIAAAAVITSGSAWANELDGRQSLEQVTASLAERTFTIDQKANKIVEEDEAPVIDGRNNSGLDFEMTA
ncbi:hypothetical protein HETIRDRAFT_442473 [Heterobasidion irregulare TC 32-1]|uniref:Uncharacterized protein n=1 Tax=Heterobasidion irregulare (strain TC 32-1) TaxID=747525 RepID=W4JNU9_HETIT|nr:uncharacterized protein HETIRDRAFT_442473 [Heterobasidion irregulare TC 32-1]ETW75232.1 hypothetical protein HETIRDRAFT_442473 [Heterobasidion irregulare TC 32-1]